MYQIKEPPEIFAVEKLQFPPHRPGHCRTRTRGGDSDSKQTPLHHRRNDKVCQSRLIDNIDQTGRILRNCGIHLIIRGRRNSKKGPLQVSLPVGPRQVLYGAFLFLSLEKIGQAGADDFDLRPGTEEARHLSLSHLAAADHHALLAFQVDKGRIVPGTHCSAAPLDFSIRTAQRIPFFASCADRLEGYFATSCLKTSCALSFILSALYDLPRRSNASSALL